MKKVIIISLFVLGLIIPNINVKAVNVSNEEQLRAAIKQGGDITLTDNIEVTQPLIIDKDVNISGRYHIMMQGDNTLMTVNSGNVILDVGLMAGWNGQYNEWGYPNDVIKNQGIALEINSGNVNLNNSGLYAGNVGIEVNGGTVTGNPSIYAGEEAENGTYSGGQGMIVNGGNVELNDLDIASGGTVLTVNDGANVTLNVAEINSYEENGIEVNNGANVTLTAESYYAIIINSYEGNGIEVNDGSVVNVILTNEYSNTNINSYERNGIEVNDGSVVNINLTKGRTPIFGSKNAIYLNGGSINLNGSIGLSSSTEGKGIYINKGVNTVTGGDILNLGKDFVFSYEEGTTPNFSIYVNPEIKELRVIDEKGFMELLDNKLNLGFCGGSWAPISQTEEERKATCSALDANYDGPIESNELGKCTTVYINSVKQNEPDASCNPVVDNENNEQNPQIVEVPSTSAYGSIIIIVLGIICVIVSVFVMRRVTKKTN